MHLFPQGLHPTFLLGILSLFMFRAWRCEPLRCSIVIIDHLVRDVWNQSSSISFCLGVMKLISIKSLEFAHTKAKKIPF
jgi:hypothetical protein